MQDNRIKRKYPQPMKDVVKDFIRELKLASGLNNQRIFAAWDELSCASRYTSGRYFKDGVLYVYLRSSVVRSSLSFQLDTIMAAINEWLKKDELFVKDSPDTQYVSKIVLR